MKKLLGFFIERPLIVNLIMLLVVLVGIYTLRTLEVQSATNAEFGIFSVTAVRAGASAEKMELSVTVPLEEELLKVENIKRVISNSMEGLSIIQISAHGHASKDELAKIELELQKAINRAEARLPTDILEQPLLHTGKTTDKPVAELMISGTASEERIRKVARQLQDKIREIPGVVSIERLGYRDRELHIKLKPQEVSRLGVSYDEIEQAIRGRNVTETGGSLASFIGEQDVVAIGEFDDPLDVETVVVRAQEDGDYLLLRDIADVVMDYEDWQTRYAFKGNPGVLLAVLPAKKSMNLLLLLRSIVKLRR